MPAMLPLGEEFLEQLVEEPSALERRPRILVFGLFLQRQHLRRVKAERTIEIALEPADRDPRQPPSTNGAAKPRERVVASVRARASPRRDSRGQRLERMRRQRHRLVLEDPRGRQRRRGRRDEARAWNLVQEHRRLNDGIVLQQDGGDSDDAVR
jgi:hypothetical protein